MTNTTALAVELRLGDCMEILPTLGAGSVHCVVTSPPYWGLRDYGLPPSVWGGDAECEHEWDKTVVPPKHSDDGKTGSTLVGSTTRQEQAQRSSSEYTFCRLCGAWRGCLGLEPTPDLYVEHLVSVFRAVRRVMRDNATLWLNLGDSYAGAGDRPAGKGNERGQQKKHKTPDAEIGLKPKDLVGIPWRVAFALQADGWWLRSDIIWHKPNCMPESVRDRPTKAHEYIFLLSKSARYWYDADAVREPYHENSKKRYDYAFDGDGYKSPTKNPAARPDGVIKQNPAGRNKRTVWTIPTKPYSEAHFAVFPPALVEPCILAGCPVDGTVLDPFCGSGTVGAVAIEWGRNAILIDLSDEYLDLTKKRIGRVQVRMLL